MGYFDPTDYTIIDPPEDGEIPEEVIAEKVNQYMDSHPVEVESLDGFSSRIPQAEYNPSDYLVVDDGETAEKIQIKEFIENSRKAIYTGKNYAYIADNFYWASGNKAIIRSDKKGGIIFNSVGTSVYASLKPSATEMEAGTYVFKPHPLFSDDLYLWIFRWDKSKTWDDRAIVKTVKTTDSIITITEEQAEQYYYVPMLVATSTYIAENLNLSFEWYKMVDSDGIGTNQGLSIQLNDVDGRVTTLENKTDIIDMFQVSQDANVEKKPNSFSVTNHKSSSANLPVSGNGYYIMSFMQGDRQYEGQIALRIGSSDSALFTRNKIAGTWQPWTRLITQNELTQIHTRTIANISEISATAAEYKVQPWTNAGDTLYDLLKFQLFQNYNVLHDITVPLSYFNSTNSNTKIKIYNWEENMYYEIYKGSDSEHITIKASTNVENTSYTYRIRVYGIKY